MPPEANEITELPARRWAKAQKSKYHIYNLQLQGPRGVFQMERASDSDRDRWRKTE